MKIQPNKALGQNFLKDEEALGMIISSANLSDKDKVLEIGPGTGVLTKELIKYAGRVIAVEKDEKLAAYLASSIRAQRPGAAEIKIITDDILKINLPALIEENKFIGYKLVANIPYYITGKIIRLFLETKYPPQSLTLLLQKEVAERICAEPGDMSILSVSVQYYGKPELKMIVPRTSFEPQPEVDSAILHLELFRRKELVEDGKFFKIVKSGFAGKRKTLANNLSSALKKNKSEVEDLLKELGLDRQIRAQALSVEDWKRLESALYSL